MLDGVDWAEEELSRSSLDSMFWICSFCTATPEQEHLFASGALETTHGTFKIIVSSCILCGHCTVFCVCACVSHVEGLRNAVVVPRLLGGEAFVGCVAGVSKPRPLLKLVHAVLCLL